MKFHFIGIGGAGMSVVAELLASQGNEVSGSDALASPVTDYLKTCGITVFIGQASENVPAESVVVVSSAIRDSNPELAIARRRGQRVLHRSQALAVAGSGLTFVAVAGAHGKTTTSAMLATALERCGKEPSWAIGASVRGFGAGGHLGAGAVFVAEADESDGSFLNYTPAIEIVTNVEPDHLDHYWSTAAFEQAFADFAGCLVPGGLLIACSEDPGARRLAMQAISEGIRVVSYGRGDGIAGAEGHVEVSGEVHQGGTVSGVFTWAEQSVNITMQVPGSHNLLNAAGAWAAGIELGCNPQQFAGNLGEFAGTGRRFETRGIVAGITVIDDYAHHPTEVAATLGAAREQVGEGRVLALFQPHLYSRTRNFAGEFAEALKLADRAIVTGVYAAREDPMDGVEGDLIANLLGANGSFVQDKTEAAHQIAGEAHAGDVILTIGAGDVTNLGPVILEDLASR